MKSPGCYFTGYPKNLFLLRGVAFIPVTVYTPEQELENNPVVAGCPDKGYLYPTFIRIPLLIDREIQNI
jgi:hypothetical protein